MIGIIVVLTVVPSTLKSESLTTSRNPLHFTCAPNAELLSNLHTRLATRPKWENDFQLRAEVRTDGYFA